MVSPVSPGINYARVMDFNIGREIDSGLSGDCIVRYALHARVCAELEVLGCRMQGVMLRKAIV